MSCLHGYHGCGPWYGGPYGPGWYDPVEYGTEEWPTRQRSRRYRRMDRETATEELEERLAALRNEIRRVEADLGSLRGSNEEAAERP